MAMPLGGLPKGRPCNLFALTLANAIQYLQQRTRRTRPHRLHACWLKSRAHMALGQCRHHGGKVRLLQGLPSLSEGVHSKQQILICYWGQAVEGSCDVSATRWHQAWATRCDRKCLVTDSFASDVTGSVCLSLSSAWRLEQAVARWGNVAGHNEARVRHHLHGIC